MGARVGDSIIPWQNTDIPGYEEALVGGIHERVSEGDDVTIVGGGWGVSTVVTAKCVGAEGSVTTYEASPTAVANVRETIRMNHVFGNTDVRHAIVAEGISIRGDVGVEEANTIVSPTELPDCDVLVLDCEGAEVPILSKMVIEPETIIVETHGMFGASVSKIRAIIESRGYRTTNKGVAEPRLSDLCMNNEVFVLVADSSL